MGNGITITVNAETAAASQRLQEFFSQGIDGMVRMSGAGELLAGLGQRLAAVLSVGAVIGFAKEAINTAEGLKVMSQETGFSIEMLSGLKEQAASTRIGFDGIENALGIFSDKLGIAVRFGGQASTAFRDLIGVKGLQGFATGAKDINGALADVIRAFNAMEDGPKKTALAVELFGRAGREVLPVLRELADGKIGKGFVSPEAAQEAAEFNTKLRETFEVAHNVALLVAQDMLPTLNRFVDWMKQAHEEMASAKDVAEGLGGAWRGLATTGLAVGFVIGDGFALIGKGAAMMLQYEESLLEAWGAFFKTFAALAAEAGKALIELAKRGLEAAKALVLVEGGNYGDALKSFQAAVSGLGAEAAGHGKAIGNALKTGFEDGAAAAKKFWAAENAMMKEATVTALFDWGKLFQRIESLWKGFSSGSAAAPPGGRFGQGKEYEEAAYGAGGATGSSVQPGSATRNAGTLTESGDQYFKELQKAAAESKGKLAALEVELGQEVEKVNREIRITSEEKADEATWLIYQSYYKKRTQVEQQHADALREIELARVVGERQIVEKDPYTTEADKKGKLLVLLRQENDELQKGIAINERRVKDPNLSDEAHLSAVKQLQDLRQKSGELQVDITKTSGGGTLAGEFKLALTEIGQAFGTWQKQMAEGFKQTWTTSVSAIGNGITDVIYKTKQWGQVMAELGQSLVRIWVNKIIEIGAQWLLTHVFMQAVSSAFHAFQVALGIKETAEHAVQTGAKVTTHAEGEAAQTSTTFLGGVLRGASRLGETIFHGVQVAIRVAAHIAGEVLMTAVTVAQSAIRVVSIIAEALIYLIKAAFQGASSVADIPYVGPILAIAAMAAIIGAGAAYMAKGFDTGGFTGSGNPKEPAGIVHKGEVVFSAQDVARHGGVANVEALRQGIVSPGSKPLAVQAFAVAGAQGPAGKSGRTNIDNRIAFGFYDDKASTIKFLNSQEGQNWFVHMQDKTAHRVGRT